MVNTAEQYETQIKPLDGTCAFLQNKSGTNHMQKAKLSRYEY